MSAQQMRGLQMFIHDIRNCKTKEAEQKRVEKELAHIRKKFTDKRLDGYGRKKYVWKLVYMYIMGHDVDFGHMVALQLITSKKYSEKTAGYLACAILLNENHDVLRLLVQTVKNDIASLNETDQCLALDLVANVGGQEYAESLANDIQRHVLATETRIFVRKKAALALLRLFRKDPECIQTETLGPEIVKLILHEHLGFVCCVMSLILAMVSHDPVGFEGGVVNAISLLFNMVSIPSERRRRKELRAAGAITAATPSFRTRHAEYSYYRTINPWTQVKLLHFLQFFPPTEDAGAAKKIVQVVEAIVQNTRLEKNMNKVHADHAVLFETIRLLIHYSRFAEWSMKPQVVKLLETCTTTLAKYLQTTKEPNIRYLALDLMALLWHAPGMMARLRTHQSRIISSLEERDISIRKRALDVLFHMCDKSNASDIVKELLQQLEKADYGMREELVLKIAILAEKFATDLRWYLDVILQLISVAGDFVSNDIWYRAVQIVTNNEGLQAYAVETVLKYLRKGGVHENGVKVAGYIVGEFAPELTAGGEEKPGVSGQELFRVLDAYFVTASMETKAILLSAYIKLVRTFPELKSRVQKILQQHHRFVDTEIQQRSVEYFNMNEHENEELIFDVFDAMPAFEIESKLLRRLQKKMTNRDPFEKFKKKRKKEEEEEEEEEEESEEEYSESASEEKEESEEEEEEEDGFPSQDLSSFRSFLTKPSGILYAAPRLQLGLKMQTGVGNECKFIVYIGNRSSSTLENVTVRVPHMTEMEVLFRPQESFNVQAKQQVPVYFLLRCMRPFSKHPRVVLGFNLEGRAHTLHLQLPCFMSHFIVGSEHTRSSYIDLWRSTGNLASQVLQCEEELSVKELKQMVTNATKSKVVEGVEKDSANFVTAGIFHTYSKRGEDFVTMPVLMRLESKEGSRFVRVSIKSGYTTVTEGVMQVIMKLFGHKAE